jgi:hypothetical protein
VQLIKAERTTLACGPRVQGVHWSESGGSGGVRGGDVTGRSQRLRAREEAGESGLAAAWAGRLAGPLCELGCYGWVAGLPRKAGPRSTALLLAGLEKGCRAALNGRKGKE